MNSILVCFVIFVIVVTFVDAAVGRAVGQW
jgi:hypothetical protein